MLHKEQTDSGICMATNLFTSAILVYGFVVAIGGILGYAKARSRVSLISGVASGVALAIAWVASLSNPQQGLLLAVFIAFALLTVFAGRYIRSRRFMPSGLLALVSLIAALYFLWGLQTVSGTGAIAPSAVEAVQRNLLG